MSAPGHGIHIINVGANVGHWSVVMLTAHTGGRKALSPFGGITLERMGQLLNLACSPGRKRTLTVGRVPTPPAIVMSDLTPLVKVNEVRHAAPCYSRQAWRNRRYRDTLDTGLARRRLGVSHARSRCICPAWFMIAHP